MRIWTTQSVDFWNQLQEQGVIYCSTQKSYWAEEFRGPYDWMASLMVKRVGPPPVPGVDYPIWGWQQVGSYKKDYHGSMTDCAGEDDEFVFMTVDIPDNQVLLSDFNLWHCVLNHWYADLEKHKNEPDEEAAIVKSWDNIFDFNRRGKYIRHRRNLWIQATFWELRKEWVLDSKRIKGYRLYRQQLFERNERV